MVHIGEVLYNEEEWSEMTLNFSKGKMITVARKEPNSVAQGNLKEGS